MLWWGPRKNSSSPCLSHASLRKGPSPRHSYYDELQTVSHSYKVKIKAWMKRTKFYMNIPNSKKNSWDTYHWFDNVGKKCFECFSFFIFFFKRKIKKKNLNENFSFLYLFSSFYLYPHTGICSFHHSSVSTSILAVPTTYKSTIHVLYAFKYVCMCAVCM